MSVAILLDTNLLVYPYDVADLDRAVRAEAVLSALAPTRRAAVSTQILGEFFRVLTTRLRPPIPPARAYATLERHIATWPVLQVTPAVVLEAARGVRDHALNFWDAQVWATARLYQVPVVFSEDFANGRTLEGVTFVNPLTDDFRLEEWL